MSFLGIHDFGGFAAATLAIGFAGIVLAERRRLTIAAVVAGARRRDPRRPRSSPTPGVVLAAIARGRGRARDGHAHRCAAGSRSSASCSSSASACSALRSYDVTNFLSLLRRRRPDRDDEPGRADWLATRDARLHRPADLAATIPILGVGFERSDVPATGRTSPTRSAASRTSRRRRTPRTQHPWGVQNFWIQLLADVGVVGLALALATFVAGLVLALRATPRRSRSAALAAAGWILVAAGTWNAVGIVAGIPLQALTWLGLGLAATLTAGLE